MNQIKNRDRLRFSLRSTAILAAIVGAAVFLGAVLFRIQITDSEYYTQKVANQLTYSGTLKASRGVILDSEGEQLAGNITKYRIFISPDSIIESKKTAAEKITAERLKSSGPIGRIFGSSAKTETDETDSETSVSISIHKDIIIAVGLSEICGVDFQTVLELTGKSGRLDETVVASADEEMALKVKAFIQEYGLSGLVYVQEISERYYFYGNLASNVLGFTGASGEGLYGLEYYYDEYLCGTDGRYTASKDRRSNIINDEYTSYVEPENGSTLNLTINRKVQEILEEQLLEACKDSNALNGGCGIVMNVKTGAILAMASYPDYDCNNPRTLTGFYADELNSSAFDRESEEYLGLLGELQLELWSNKAVSFSYIPGSTFKIITTGIALESARVKATDKYTCNGSVRAIDGTLIHCSNLYGHGTLTFSQGLQQSCNPWFIKAGLEVGTSLFYDYVENFGYFTKSGIDLPGEGSTIFWSRDSFSQMDLTTCAFGQNFKVSPIRHLACIAAIANQGVLVEPYVVQSIEDSDGKTVYAHKTETVRQVLSQSVAQQVSNILAEGVAGNGGSRNAYVAGYRVAAKTGTSEKIGDDEENKICSCVAFAPVDDPEIIMMIIVDSPTEGTIFGSTIAAPYVSECLSEMLPYLGVEAVYTEAEEAKRNVTVGDYVGTVPFTAQSAIEKLGLDYEIVGNGTQVSGQVPVAGSSLPKDSGKVVLYLGDNTPQNGIRIPNLLGMSAVTAKQTLINYGLNINIEGTSNYDIGSGSAAGAVVIEQSPAAGSAATRGDIVRVTFRYLNISDD